MTDRPIDIILPHDVQPYRYLGGLTCIIPSAQTADACTVLQLRLAPGQGSGLHLHQHEQEIVQVQEGSCTVGNQTESWDLAAGSWAIFPKQTVHFFHNRSADTCTLTITATPGGLDRYFATVNAALERQDEQAIAAANLAYGITFLT